MSVFGAPPASTEAVRIAALERQVEELLTTIAANAGAAAQAVDSVAQDRAAGDVAVIGLTQEEQEGRQRGDQLLADALAGHAQNQETLARDVAGQLVLTEAARQQSITQTNRSEETRVEVAALKNGTEAARDAAAARAQEARDAAQLADQATADATAEIALTATERARTEALRQSTLIAKTQAEDATQGAQALIDAGLDIAAVGPRAAEARIYAEVARSAVRDVPARTYLVAIPGLTAPETYGGDFTFAQVWRSGQITETAAAVAALPPPVRTYVVAIPSLSAPQLYFGDNAFNQTGLVPREAVDQTGLVEAAAVAAVRSQTRGPYSVALPGLLAPTLYFGNTAFQQLDAFTGGGAAASAAPIAPRTYVKGLTTSGQALASLLSTTTMTMYCIAHGGQSLAIGGFVDSVALRVLSTVPVGRNYSTPEGPWAIDNPFWTELVPAVETIHRGGSYGETGAVAFANQLATLMQQEFGSYPLFSVLTFGAGGTLIENLDRSSEAYQNFLTGIRTAMAWCTARGIAFVVPFLRWIHGNKNVGVTSAQQYAALLIRFQQWLDEDVRAITGQVERIILYMDQGDFLKGAGLVVGGVRTDDASKVVAPVGVILGQVLAAQMMPDVIRLLGSNQDIQRHDGTHPFPAGYYQMGQRAAQLVFIDYFITPKPAFVPVWKRRASATAWDFGFEPWVGGLVLDTSGEVIRVEGLNFGRAANGYGFEFEDGSANPPIVTGVEVRTGPPLNLNPLRNDVVRVTLSAEPTGYAPRMNYAGRTNYVDDSEDSGSGPTNGGRGCLRDEALWLSDRDIDGALVSTGATPFPQRHWMNRWSEDLPR